ncbi:hypothetical protein [Actinoplanes philippinensis]|uniref:hypothetical protein n=1 Tax=Actinoplanes philippinensis TaxID=35752 RepID=UPI0033C384E6
MQSRTPVPLTGLTGAGPDAAGASPRNRTAPATVDGSPGGRPQRDGPSGPVRATGLGSSLAAWLQRNRERPGAAPRDPRVFELLRAVGQDELREHRLEVESRPDRTYPRRWPGSRRADPVRLDYHGVGLLQAATHAHDGVRTRGLGLMFPAYTVHARDSTAAVAGNDCELTHVDHVHIRQAVIADDDTLRSPRVRRALARAVPGRDTTRVARTLRSTLSRLVERPAGNGPAQGEPVGVVQHPRAGRPPRATCTAEIHDCESVQLGDDAMTRLDSHYVVERTVIPAGALLAGSEDLARRYVALVTGEAADPGTLADFLCALVGAAENAEDDNLLGYADGLPRRPATLLGLFGMTSIDDMTSIMIGTGDEPHPELDLTTARPALDGSPAGRLTQPPPAVTTPLAPATGTRSTVPPPVSEPLYRPPAASPPRPAPAAPHPTSRPSATPAPHPPTPPTSRPPTPPPGPPTSYPPTPPPGPPTSHPNTPPSHSAAAPPPATPLPAPQPQPTPTAPSPPDRLTPAIPRSTPQPHPTPTAPSPPGKIPPLSPSSGPEPGPDSQDPRYRPGPSSEGRLDEGWRGP